MPSLGSSKPPIMRSVVVFPQPEGPSSAKKLPRGDLEREGVDRDDLVEALRDAVEADVRCGRLAPAVADGSTRSSTAIRQSIFAITCLICV